MKPLVSVIIACLNDVAHLPRAVESVLSQTYADVELVIMDGASQDGTVNYLRSLEDSRVTWQSQRDGGITPAWNNAIARACGDWIMFLGADDYIWDSEVIAKAAPYLMENSHAAFAFGEVCIVAEHGDAVVQRAKFDRPALLAQLRGPRGLGLPHQGFLHNRRAFENGLFDPSFRLAADYEFISRFSAEEDFLFLPIGPVAAFRMGGLSTSAWVTLEAYREFARVHRLRGRGRFHGAWQLSKAHVKAALRGLLGARLARHIVNGSRALRRMPPYT